MGDSGRTYKQEEVTEILKRALKAQSMRDKVLSHDELVEMAAEVGIDKAALEAATTELAQSKADELARQGEVHELAAERARLFSRFVLSFVNYIVINTLLFFIDRRFTGGTWFYWVLIGWGLLLLLQIRNIVFPQASLARRRHREWKDQQRLARRAAREERRRRLQDKIADGVATAQAIEHGAKEFENAVQAGVAALLGVAARKIRETADRHAEAERQGGRPRPQDVSRGRRL
jgi:2TM domain